MASAVVSVKARRRRDMARHGSHSVPAAVPS
jgi:hypothetical protein